MNANLKSVYIEINKQEKVLRLYTETDEGEIDTLSITFLHPDVTEFMETIESALEIIFTNNSNSNSNS